MELLKAKNIKKSFPESEHRLEVLKGIDLNVNKQEKVVITGESGSGKSTLLHILGMLDKPDAGEIFFENKKIDFKMKNINKFRNQEIGFVFQFHYLLEDFTAEENVAMPMFLATNDKQKSISKANGILKILDMQHRKDHYPNQLSGGEQQRIAVARALINDPKIVFADEPTGNLDQKHSDILLDYLIKLNEEKGQTFVIVTHDISLAKKMDVHLRLQEGFLKTNSR